MIVTYGLQLVRKIKLFSLPVSLLSICLRQMTYVHVTECYHINQCYSDVEDLLLHIFDNYYILTIETSMQFQIKFQIIVAAKVLILVMQQQKSINGDNSIR